MPLTVLLHALWEYDDCVDQISPLRLACSYTTPHSGEWEGSVCPGVCSPPPTLQQSPPPQLEIWNSSDPCFSPTAPEMKPLQSKSETASVSQLIDISLETHEDFPQQSSFCSVLAVGWALPEGEVGGGQ